jgi:gas vesicle protein
MKLKPEIWNIILLVGLIALTIFTLVDKIQANAELKALKKSYDLLDENLEAQKNENIIQIDQLIKNSKKELIEKQGKSIDSLLKIWTSKPKEPKYDTTIDHINDIDSISKLFNRFYPDPNKP